MIQLNKEYFESPYYFFLKEKEDKISLYYSFSNTLSEARKNDSKLDFGKKNKLPLKKKIDNIIKTKKHKNSKDLQRDIESFKNKIETNEFIDSDGSLSTSKIPILDPKVYDTWTTDQIVPSSRISNDPITRGYRVYYGESELKETDFSDAFGYDETKNMDGKKTFNFLKNKMGLDPIEAAERTKQFGKDYTGKRKNKAPKKIRNNPNFIDRMTLSETQRSQMIKMVEDILKKKKDKSDDLIKGETNISKFLETNIKSLKKLAEKEGISLNKLISILKKGE
jgi:hypothetical protein